MIVNIRGTHGSGKTTLVKSFLAGSADWQSEFISTRKRPFGYLNVTRKLWILGHYEIDGGCGGCDTIPKVDDMFDSIKEKTVQGYNVLYEGILAQHGVPRVIELNRLFPQQVVVIVLSTPLQQCIDDVNARRAAKGNGPLDPPTTIEGEYRSVLSSAKRLKEARVDVRHASRMEALGMAQELLKWNS